LNSKLSIQEKIKTRLLADISHELKTPITSISCYLEGIQDGVIKLDNETL
jgi:two-component system sensor histidine kinase BaeS